MKLKKKDLVRDFEEIVKQEIKNHNEAVLASNQKINEFAHSLQKIDQKIDKVSSKLDSQIKDLEISLEKLTDEFLDSQSLEKSEIHTLKKRFNVLYGSSLELKKEAQEIEENKKAIRNLQQEIKDVSQHQNNLEQDVPHLIHQVKKDLSSYMASKIGDLKKLFASTPKEIENIQTEVNKKIKATVIDRKGIDEELQKIKKNYFIQSKHIEDLYTLYKRIMK